MILDYVIEIFLPLFVTFVITWLVGLERQNIGKSAGISAHVLVSVASCAIAIMQREITKDFQSSDNQRVIAQVVTGLGFLGAGVIIKSNDRVRGLTTAATLWSCAMTGLIIGMGYYPLGVTLGVFMVLFMYLRDAIRHINPFKSHRDEHDNSRQIDH